MPFDQVSTLIVEDDPTARHLIRDIVKARGHDAVACGDAESGWDSFRKEGHDLVLLDMKLPGMDGLELCRMIRREPKADGTVILFITGSDDRDALEAALDAGADDYVEKPVVDSPLHVRLSIAERRIRELRTRRRMEEELRKDALHDPLTGLPNRSLFIERLDRAARRSERDRESIFAVLYLNVDDFSDVNRRLGHDAGDQVLTRIGHRLEDCVRGVDTVARVAGDEFTVLLDDLKDLSDPTRVAQRIHAALSNPIGTQEGSTLVTVSIGIALSISGFDDPQEVVRNARQALRRAKSQGSGSHQMYDPVMHARAVARIRLETRIRSALDKDEMTLNYQPIVSLSSGRVEAFEALLRWNDPDRGPVGPDDFVPVAEETGLILPLGWWALERACREVQGWREANPEMRPLGVAVNVSARQFSQPELLDELDERINRSGISADAVHLELTESVLMSNAQSTERTLHRLKERGIKLHVDDFGTGYSSLSYLCRFPIDSIKIDRSFITEIIRQPEYLEIVRTVVRLAKNLELSVIAEGVETEQQREVLNDLGCDYVQGFLFSRARDPGEVPDLLAGWAA